MSDDDPTPKTEPAAPDATPEPPPSERDPTEGFETQVSLRERDPTRGFKTRSKIFKEVKPD